MDEYKPNSHKSKEEKSNTSEKNIEKIVTGTVKTKKKSDIHKLTDIFISDDVTKVKNYVLMDVLVPAIKKAVSDIVTNGISMILYGDASGSSSRTSSTSKISYRNYYDRDEHRDYGSRPRAGYCFDDIILGSRGEAEMVLEKMDEIISTYGNISVADLYELVDITGNYTDNKYGWTDIQTAKVVPVRDGYMIKLPRALPLD